MRLVIACAAGLCVWLLLPRSPRARLQRVLAVPEAARASSRPLPLRRIAATAAGVGVAVLLWSALGIAVGVVLAVAVHRLTGGLESRALRDRRERLQAQVPDICELLNAMLASGAPPDRSVAAVSAAVGPPGAQVLDQVVRALHLGATPAEAWRAAAREPALARIAAAFDRSARTGAPIADVLSGLAADERQRRRRAIEVAARSAGVRAVAPLAACFLPSFILLGIVPVVASMASQALAS